MKPSIIGKLGVFIALVLLATSAAQAAPKKRKAKGKAKTG